MRPQSDSDAGKNQVAPGGAVGRDPSYPDRARIDSDVRAFLRPASSPWIVFDRDSRVDGQDFGRAALRVGAVFASSPSLPGHSHEDERRMAEAMAKTLPAALPGPAPAEPSVVVKPDPLVNERMFPPSAVEELVVEPSNLVVASDVGAVPDPFRAGPAHDDLAGAGLPASRRRRTVVVAAGTVAAIAAALLLAVGAARVMKTHGRAPSAAATAITPAPPRPDAAEPAPAIPDVEPAAAAIELDPAPAAEAPEPKPAADARKKAPVSQFGRLTIKGEAKYKNVFFDGKRLLGTGQRGFPVLCGMHTIAVGDKTDAKDVEVPCNGEYVVAK
jgi:hypothetical protein